MYVVSLQADFAKSGQKPDTACSSGYGIWQRGPGQIV
jgi:hypothetical protein